MMLHQLCEETLRLEYVMRLVKPLHVKGALTCDIRGVTCDSRQVRPGWLFTALPGAHADGAQYIEDAIQRGAVAVVTEREIRPRRDVTVIQVGDARLALAMIACAFHENPSRHLALIGITGTNGKTTAAFICRAMLAAAGRRPGLLGTVRYEIGERILPAEHTTPEAPDLQRMLDQMVRAGCRSAVMEVSSHGLAQHRVCGIDFDVGVFTNLTRDHLDYHATMEQYFAAKCQLFTNLGSMEKRAAAAINLDDAYGLQLANIGGFSARLLTFGAHPAAMVRAEDVEFSAAGSAFRLVTPWGETAVRLPLLGRYNVSNALAAVAACGALETPLEVMRRTLESVEAPPGRLERVPNARGLQVFVDYAHTDDALANVLRTLREVSPQRLIVVFGCGGDRDRTKRPLMGAVAARLADQAVITSDNPRSEDPAAIIAGVAAGFGAAAHFETEPDRARAIARAVALARPGDTVLIAGKGHETTQEFAQTKVPFDDRLVAREALER